jgi:hypothetical protein
VLEVLAPPHLHWGKEHYPFRIDLVVSAQSLARRWLDAGHSSGVSGQWGQSDAGHAS